MTGYTVTLSCLAYVTARISVEANSFEEAERIAIENASRAAWPNDDQGEAIAPGELTPIFATYLRADDDDESERHLTEPPHLAISRAASDILAALRLANPVCEDAVYDAQDDEAEAAARTAWDAVKAAIAKAEGRADAR